MNSSRNLLSKLKHKIEIEHATHLDDGEQIWNVKHIAFAEIMPVAKTSFKEFDDFSFGHLLTEELFVFTIRFIKNLNINNRVKFGDRIFTIKRIINPCELNHILKIIALEITEEI